MEKLQKQNVAFSVHFDHEQTMTYHFNSVPAA